MTVMRRMEAGMAALAMLVALSACHRVSPAQSGVVRQAPAVAAARSTTPDDDRLLMNDTRRAQGWHADAERIMAIHTTAMNSLTLSASCNVYFSNGAYFESKPAIFLARHYGMPGVAQYLELTDHTATARILQALSEPPVRAADAWNLARRIGPAVTPPVAPTPVAVPSVVAQSVYQPQNRFFSSSRAFLLKLEDHMPEWWVFANRQKFVINAVSRDVQGPLPQQDPGDPLQQGLDVDLQRAAAIWLPTHPFKSNDRSEPSPTN